MRLADWPPIPHLAPGLTPTRLLTWSESFRLPLQEALVVSFFPLEGLLYLYGAFKSSPSIHPSNKHRRKARNYEVAAKGAKIYSF